MATVTEAPIADLPSGEPIPSSAPPASPPPLPLRTLLAAAPSHADAFLAHLSRCLATPSGIDTLFLFVGYSARLSASALSVLARPALRRSARRWLALVASLPPGTASVTTTSTPPALVLAARLRALSSLLSEARTILRLWSLLGMYFWGRTLVLRALRTFKAKTEEETNEKKETVSPFTPPEAAVAFAQLSLCVGFQALENGAYLSSRGILAWSPDTQRRAYRLSARLWGCHIGLELGRLLAEATGHAPAKFWPDRSLWRRQLVRNLAWAPLTVHWGSETGLVPDWVVAAVALVPGVMGMRQLWKDTAT